MAANSAPTTAPVHGSVFPRQSPRVCCRNWTRHRWTNRYENLAPLSGKQYGDTIGLTGTGVNYSTTSTDRSSFLLCSNAADALLKLVFLTVSVALAMMHCARRLTLIEAVTDVCGPCASQHANPCGFRRAWADRKDGAVSSAAGGRSA
ncbi:hypothetical protein EMIT0P291_210059 [Pseudomonas sp. IT-P291]